MVFSELVDFSKRDAIWTQRGFFPGDLIPSKAFKTRFPSVQTATIAIPDVLKHLNVLVRDIAPLWKSMDEQFMLKSKLFKIYGIIERFAASSNLNRQWFVNHSKLYLQVPYILNSDDKDSSEATSWIWPAQLMFGIDSSIPSHYVVDLKLRDYRNFLVAAGALEIVPVVGEVHVKAGRARGFMEDQIMKHFESQSRRTGFMDVRFKFKEGSDILAHKVVLVSANRFIFDPIAGLLPLTAIMDPNALVNETVDLSDHGYIRGAFWGLLYYFYSEKLIQSNGPPVLKYQKEGGEPVVVREFDRNDDGESGVRQKPVEDQLAQRVQYLMELQDVANRFEVSRLKDLIAQEIIMGQKVIHSNVFSIRDHAKHNQADNVREHCDLFIEKNKAGVIKYVEGEIHVLRDELEELDRKEKAKEDDDEDDYEPSELLDDEEYGEESDESSDEFFECENMDNTDTHVEGGWAWGTYQMDERSRERMIKVEYYNSMKLLRARLNEKLEGMVRNLMELHKEP